MAAKKHTKTWLITGGSGFIGEALVAALKQGGTGQNKKQIIVLSRNQNKTQVKLGRGVQVVTSLDDIAASETIDVVVNLAGEPLFDGLWTKKRKQAFFDSRLGTTQALITLFDRLETKPAMMISGSAIGYYGMDETREFHECAEAGSDDMARLCTEWEAAAKPAEAMGIRLVFLRIGLVLDDAGGMLAPLKLSSKLGLGARLGSGKQWMSWVSRTDLVNMILFAASHPAVKGPMNGTAPNPVTQRHFADALAKKVRRPRLLWVPGLFLKLFLGQMASLLLGGQKVLPRKAIDMGFDFKHTDVEDAL